MADEGGSTHERVMSQLTEFSAVCGLNMNPEALEIVSMLPAMYH